MTSDDEKAQEIVGLVRRLREGFNDVVVVDHWECDRAAIGLERRGAPGWLAYVTCQPDHPDTFYVALEGPPVSGSNCPYQPMGEFSDLDEAEVFATVSNHLRLIKRAGDS